MEDFAQIHNPSFYFSILNKLKIDNLQVKIEALKSLSNLLTYADQDRLNGFPLDLFSSELLELLNATTDGNIAKLSAQCVFGLLEAHSRSTSSLMKFQVLTILASHLLNCKWFEASEYCLKALHVISKYRANEISYKIGIEPFLKMFDHFTIISQRDAIDATENITKSVVPTPSMVNHLDQLIKIAENTDQKIQSSAIKTVNSITSQLLPESIPTAITHKLAARPKFYLQSLLNLSTNKEHIAEILKSGINFQNLLDSIKNTEMQTNIFKIILNLLPFCNTLKTFKLDKHQRAPESDSFAFTIQPLLLKLLMENPISLKHLLMCFISTLEKNKIELTEDLAFALKGFGDNPECSPYVLAVLTFYQTSPLIAQSGILSGLTNITLSGQQKNWFTRTINKITKNVNSTPQNHQSFDNSSLSDILAAINTPNLSKFSFLQTGVPRLLQLSAEFGQTNKNDLSKLANFVLSLLSYASLPTVSENVTNSYMDNFSLGESIDLTLPNNEHNRVQLSRYDTVGSLECEYNQMTNDSDYNIDNLKQCASSKPTLQSMVFSKSLRKLTAEQLSVLYRAFIPHYPHYHIEESDSKKYNSSCSFFYIFDDLFRDYSLKLVEGDCQSVDTIQKTTYSSISDILPLITELGKYVPIGQNAIFTKKIHNLLSNPSLTLFHNSDSLNTIFGYPSLFPFELRHFAFKMMAYEPRAATQAWAKEFNMSAKRMPSNDPLKISVHRNSIFTDGVELFNELSSGPFRFEVSFHNEEGIGYGPTHEFFTLFSQELCKNERKLFRTESMIKNQMATDKHGLFFSPCIPPKAASLLGKFLAKTIQMECLINIPFNPALFKFLQNPQSVELKEVDPQLFHSLSHPEGLIGLNFVYPGYNIELCENGENIEVTAENLDEFVKSIQSFTCGDHMLPIRDAFIDGFNTVFPFKYLDVFTYDEINKILQGESPAIKMGDLLNYVEISHGYTVQSKEIMMLFEIITEMTKDEQSQLIQFITGYTQLPIGGLAALNPRLTVAKKEHNRYNSELQLPSCMTCTNYFKLPPYQNKETMKNKIFTAIQEGRTLFDLT